MLTIGYIISAFLFAVALLRIINSIDHHTRINIIDIAIIAMELCFIISWKVIA